MEKLICSSRTGMPGHSQPTSCGKRLSIRFLRSCGYHVTAFIKERRWKAYFPIVSHHFRGLQVEPAPVANSAGTARDLAHSRMASISSARVTLSGCVTPISASKISVVSCCFRSNAV
jgi:hypothetical protein